MVSSLVVGDALVVALLHGLHHVGALLALTLHEQVVSLFHTLPALVAVHGIEAAHDAGNMCVVLGTYVAHLLDESLTALRIGVATVHEAVDEGLVFQSVGLTHLDEFEQMVEA